MGDEDRTGCCVVGCCGGLNVGGDSFDSSGVFAADNGGVSGITAAVMDAAKGRKGCSGLGEAAFERKETAWGGGTGKRGRLVARMLGMAL